MKSKNAHLSHSYVKHKQYRPQVRFKLNKQQMNLYRFELNQQIHKVAKEKLKTNLTLMQKVIKSKIARHSLKIRFIVSNMNYIINNMILKKS